MPEGHNKLSRFWQELKRRKVTRVITVYAAAAFVILELVSIIVEPLKLPEWTLPFIIVLLCVGFIIAVIISWIYDIHPEGGIVKTEPAQVISEDSKVQAPVSSKSWKIASYISFVVIVALVVLNIIPRANNKKEILDKSIAVLPFKSLSDDPEKQYLADGVMDAILLHLSKVGDLRVLSRTSVEQYRVTDKTATEICEELDVAFVLEGSFRKYGDQARLIVQLIQPGKEGHAWANEYDREWKDIFAVESEVAQSIAQELQAVITPEVKQRIEKIPTTSLTAHEFYLRGREEYLKSSKFTYDSVAHERAGEFYQKALEYDPTFAKAYTGLAWVYFSVSFKSEFFSRTYLDSMLTLAEIALSYDSQLAEAYTIRGRYFWSKNQLDKALKEYNRALELNPNDWIAYWQRGDYHYWNHNPVQSLDDYHKAAFLNRGKGLSEILSSIGRVYSVLGFREKGLSYYQQALELDGDSAIYYLFLGNSERSIGNYEEAIKLLKKGFEIDSNHLGILNALGRDYLFIGKLEESLKYYKKHVEKIESIEDQDFFILNNWYRIGYAYSKNGFKKEAEYYFDKQVEYCNKVIELGRPYGLQLVYYDLAALYAFQGEKIRALENLSLYIQKGEIPFWGGTHIQDDPLFDNIRDEPEFQQIERDIVAKYQAEHERVRQWLEENDLL